MKQRAGFTIIELLVVIVVIAILAAISIVAYTGIQERARNAQLLSAFDTYEKALRQYKALNGTYPTATLPAGMIYACLGGPFPATGPFGVDECFKLNNTLYAQRVPAIDAAIATIIGNSPTSNQSISFQLSSNSYDIRGLLYIPSPNGATATLTYIVKSDQQCGRGAKASLTANTGAITECDLALN